MENLSYKNEDRKYMNNMQNKQFLKIRNSLFELERDFIELKDREVKIKGETEEPSYNRSLSIDDMDRLGKRKYRK